MVIYCLFLALFDIFDFKSKGKGRSTTKAFFGRNLLFKSYLGSPWVGLQSLKSVELTIFNRKTLKWKAWNISNTQKVQRCSCPDFLPRSKNLFWILGFKSIRLSPTILSLAEWTSSSIQNTQYPLNINWRCGTLIKYVWSRTHQLRKQRQKLKINSIQGIECAITFSENHRNFTTKGGSKCQNLNILMVETFRNWNCYNDLEWNRMHRSWSISSAGAEWTLNFMFQFGAS